MNNLLEISIKNVFLGLLYLVLFFIVSLALGIGLRVVFIYLKENLFPAPIKKYKPKPKRKPIKSIEINPDEVDRIVVRKN